MITLSNVAAFVFFFLVAIVVVGISYSEPVHSYEINRFENRPVTEQQLIERLFKTYNRKLRPPGSVQVKFALNLNQIVNLNQKDQIMVLNAFIDHEWIDPRLSWDPLKYDNISLIRVSGDQLWTPDTFIYTTADQTGFLLPQSGAQFVIRHEGVIFWPNPLTQMQVRCRMGIVWFPFDDQLCVIVFGSWSFTCGYLNYTLMNEDPSLDNYTENNEWTLIAFRPYRYEIKYTNWIENDSFSEIHYKILIRRKPLFVIQNCVVPAIMLCILTLVSFYIPFAQAMQIGISIMLSFSVFKLRLSDDVPVQADTVPLVNIYFTLCMSFSLNAMIWFSYINLLRSRKNVPKIIRYIVVKFLLRFKLSSMPSPNRSSPSISTTDSTANKNNLVVIRNKDGTTTTKSAFNAAGTYPHIVIDDISNISLAGSNSACYKTINDANFSSHFASENYNRHSARKKKDTREETQSDSEFEKELERLKQKKKVVNRIDNEFMCAYEVSDTCEDDSSIVWVPQNRSFKRERKLLKAHLKYLEQKSRGGDNVDNSPEFYPIRIDYDDREANIQQKKKRHSYHHRHHHRPHPHLGSSYSVYQPSPSQNTQIKKAISSSSQIQVRSNESLASSRQSSTLMANNGSTIDIKVVAQESQPQQQQQKGKKEELSDTKVINILNEFVFYLFLIFCILLNLLGLWVFPYFIKKPLSVDDI